MQSLNISSSALRGIQYALDNTANNMANLETAGYKRRAASFSELLADSMNEQPALDRENRNSPVGLRMGSGARLGMTKLDMAQGSMKPTDVPTDLMIQGEGFFYGWLADERCERCYEGRIPDDAKRKLSPGA